MMNEYLRRARSFANRMRNDSVVMDALEHYAFVAVHGHLSISHYNIVRGIPLPGHVRIRREKPRMMFHPYGHSHIPEYFAVLSQGGIPVPLTVGVMYDDLHVGCVSEDLSMGGRFRLFHTVPSDEGYVAIDPDSRAVVDVLPVSFSLEAESLARIGKRLPIPVSD